VQERAQPPQVISYEGLLVIVGGGTVDLDLLRDLYLSGAHVVGADGGADQIVAAGLRPEAIIGDFDSLRNVDEWLGRTRLLRIPEQDTTDFEKALYSTQAPVTIALGMTGRRFDHTLAALDAVTKYARDRVIILVDEADLAMGLAGPFSFEVAPRERVSVHPLLPMRFKRSIGLKFPLDSVRLAPGERTGTSNEAVDGPFRIEPEGRARPWLLVLDRKYLFGVAAAATAMAG
jgi:thiamine pyrophosphokinase